MNQATIATAIMTLLIFIIFLGFLVWGIRSRQFHDVEEPKYRMFDDKDKIEENGERGKKL